MLSSWLKTPLPVATGILQRRKEDEGCEKEAVRTQELGSDDVTAFYSNSSLGMAPFCAKKLPYVCSFVSPLPTQV